MCCNNNLCFFNKTSFSVARRALCCQQKISSVIWLSSCCHVVRWRASSVK
jgi:hypothetical protein